MESYLGSSLNCARSLDAPEDSLGGFFRKIPIGRLQGVLTFPWSLFAWGNGTRYRGANEKKKGDQ